MSIEEALGEKSTVIMVKAEDLRSWHEQVVEDTRQKFEKTLREEKAEEYIWAKDVCERLGVSRMTLQRWKNRGYLVPAMVGRKCAYKRSEIEALLTTRESK